MRCQEPWQCVPNRAHARALSFVPLAVRKKLPFSAYHCISACDYWLAEMAGTGERSYKVINARDGTFGVEISPPEQGAPLVIFGFISEAEALAWIDGEQSRATNPDAISENWL